MQSRFVNNQQPKLKFITFALRLSSLTWGQIENNARKRAIDYILSGRYASLDEIEAYCQSEILDNRKERHHIAGFAA